MERFRLFVVGFVEPHEVVEARGEVEFCLLPGGVAGSVLLRAVFGLDHVVHYKHQFPIIENSQVLGTRILFELKSL